MSKPLVAASITTAFTGADFNNKHREAEAPERNGHIHDRAGAPRRAPSICPCWAMDSKRQ